MKVQANSGDMLGLVGKPPPAMGGIPVDIPPHLHLDRAGGLDPSIAPNPGRMRRPTGDPLNDLAPLNDTIKPKVTDLHFLVGTDDRLGNFQQQGNASGERLRTDNHYFGELTRGGYLLVGRLAPTKALDRTTQATAGTGSIDILAAAYDRIGTSNLDYKVGVRSLKLSIIGKSLGVSERNIQVFDFGGEFLGANQRLADFTNFGLTRVVYANDRQSDSKAYGPYWYIVTNTASTAATPATTVESANEDRVWHSDARTGDAWNTPRTDPDALSNAESRFPDDIYTIRVTATDKAGNEGTMEMTVLLNNWQRTLTTDKGVYRPTDNVQVTGGKEYRANQNVSIYILNAQPRDGTALNAADRKAIVMTNANGVLLVKDLGQLPIGNYWIVTDYDGDGVFTGRLDAVRAIKVQMMGASLKGQSTHVSAVEGWQFTAPVATFTDDNPSPSLSDYSALIGWGDGSSSSGTIVALGNGQFEVDGTHTYAHYPPTGFLDAMVSISKVGGDQDSVASEVAVSDAPLMADGTNITVAKGSLFDLDVASLTDTNPSGSQSDFTASIDWGDGTTSPGMILPDGSGGYDIHAPHMYAQGGFHVISITVSAQGRSVAYATTYADVTDTSLSATSATVSATAGVEFSGRVASFTDSDVGGERDGYTASIDWGNGVITSGTVTTNGSGGYDVSGTNTYLTDGTYQITVYLIDTDDSTAQALSSAVVTIGTPSTVMGQRSFVTAPDAGSAPLVKVFDPGSHTERFSFYAFDPSFTGGVRVATGDINGDSVPDIVTATGAGIEGQVKVFSGVDGALLLSLVPFSGYTGGVSVAVADVNGDGLADLITGTEAGSSLVKVFSGLDSSLLTSFDAGTGGGLRVAAGDLNGDGFADVVVGAAPGSTPQVKAFSGLDNALLVSFLAYEQTFTGGVYVAVGDVDGDGLADIITGPGAGRAPDVKVFRGTDASLIRTFQAYESSFTSGVRVAVRDVNGDGRVDILTGRGPGGSPEVKLFDGLSGALLDDLFAYDPLLTGGVFVG